MYLAKIDELLKFIKIVNILPSKSCICKYAALNFPLYRGMYVYVCTYKVMQTKYH